MINAQYKLVSPHRLETFFSDINMLDGNVVVRPRMMSVCKADLRYFLGMRDAKVLKQRLPLTLIHEAEGTVLYDPTGGFAPGESVILLPNIPGRDTGIGENYRLDSRFRSSRADGFMQEVVSLPGSQVLPYKGVPKEIAAFTEFISVGVHAVRTYLERRKRDSKRIGVWGDGSLGYIVGTLLKYYLPEVELSVIGKHRTRLELFRFADETYTIDEIPSDEIWFDDVFECVGGQGSELAISQMIDTIYPEGLIMLLGVSENPVGINTRMVLEKGLTLIGRSRSRKEDFEETIRLLQENRRFVRRMKVLVSDVVEVSSISDMNDAFERSRTADFKVIMDWKV